MITSKTYKSYTNRVKDRSHLKNCNRFRISQWFRRWAAGIHILEISDCPGRTPAFFPCTTKLRYTGNMWNEVGCSGDTLLRFGNQGLAIFYKSQYILSLFLRGPPHGQLLLRTGFTTNGICNDEMHYHYTGCYRNFMDPCHFGWDGHSTTKLPG